MSVTAKHVGERFQIAESLEVVVLELAPDHVKLGIRSLDLTPNAMPPVVYSQSGGSLGYYHSDHGLAMLVVSSIAGQRLQINDSIDLAVEGVNVNGVCFSATAIDSRDSRPSFTNRLLRWTPPTRKEFHVRERFEAKR